MRLVDAQARALEVGIEAQHLSQRLVRQGDIAEIDDVEQLGAQPIVDIMGIVCNVVGERRYLRLGGRLGGQIDPVPARQVGDDFGDRPAGQRTVVLDEPLDRLPSQVETIESGIAAFELGDDAQGLSIVVEATEVLHERVEFFLAGVAKRRMPELASLAAAHA